jgi:hypothetical protein
LTLVSPVTANQRKAEFYLAGKQPYPEGKGWRETNAGRWRPTLYETEEKNNMNNDLTYYRDKNGVHYFAPPRIACPNCGYELYQRTGPS